MVLKGAVLWGLSGTVAQYLFHHEGFRHDWLVMARLIVSGGVLLAAVAFGKSGKRIWNIWKDPGDRWRVLLFAIVGLLGVQYTYFASIQAGNAATATLLQYLGPVLITIYLALRWWKVPSGFEMGAVGLALLGTFLLVTGGRPGELTVSSMAVFWGLASAVTLAFYTLFPVRLLQRWGAATVVGWGMAIGGAGLMLMTPPWQTEGQHWSWTTFSFVMFVIFFGTLLAFYLYLASLKYLKPSETGLLASAEPLSAAFASVVWLNVPFGWMEWAGSLCIIGTVVLLSRSSEKPRKDLAV
ncbi:EamA family transporter [Paludifilum halophilum]|uniref:EamA family transporter n=1 Tax=Paludifilum halophilum TaxID=1642702 RepID=A0A235BCG6_9BACL|nr:DMT family transporter [Paludifilum halophilum]OYD09984.1 EamA family transporter [Paludifilum halophilum]